MMHYKKGKNVEQELSQEQIPIEVLPQKFLWMHVKGGSKVFNLVEYAKKALEDGSHRSVVWSGSDGGVAKTISCAEIMKKDFALHQVTRVCYRRVEEYWDPTQEGLEQIVATRNIPCIHILMSLDDIDTAVPGYQHSKTKSAFWVEREGAAGEGKGPSRRDGNYFTGPQLKKKPNRHYDDGGVASSNGGNNSRGKGQDTGRRGKPEKNRSTSGNDGAGKSQRNPAETSGGGDQRSKKARPTATTGNGPSKAEKDDTL